MTYLTGAFRQQQAAALAALGVGVMLQPGNRYAATVEGLGFPCWAADNGCFAQGDAFDLDKFYRWLDGVPRSRLLFAVAPDVYGDAARTLIRSRPTLEVFRRLALPSAFVLQNGATDAIVPWEEFTWLFIGGDDEWKLGPHVRAFVLEARERGKRVHMGRVNSEARLRYAHSIGCDSADGTFLRFANRSEQGLQRIGRWFTQTLLPIGRP